MYIHRTWYLSTNTNRLFLDSPTHLWFYADARRPLGAARHSSSLGRSHLRRLFPDLSGVDDKFERVSILVLLHQLEVDKPFGICYGAAALEPVSGRFKQRSGKLVLAFRSQSFHCLD